MNRRKQRQNPATSSAGNKRVLSFLQAFFIILLCFKKTRSLAQLRYLVTRYLLVVKAAAVDLLPSASQQMLKGPRFLSCRSRYAAKLHNRRPSIGLDETVPLGRSVFRSHFRCCPTLGTTILVNLRILILDPDGYIQVDDLQAIATVTDKVGGLDVSMGYVVLVKICKPINKAPGELITKVCARIPYELSVVDRNHLRQNEPIPGSRSDSFDWRDDVRRVRGCHTEEIENVWLSRSFADELCNIFSLIRIFPSINRA